MRLRMSVSVPLPPPPPYIFMAWRRTTWIETICVNLSYLTYIVENMYFLYSSWSLRKNISTVIAKYPPGTTLERSSSEILTHGHKRNSRNTILTLEELTFNTPPRSQTTCGTPLKPFTPTLHPHKDSNYFNYIKTGEPQKFQDQTERDAATGSSL